MTWTGVMAEQFGTGADRAELFDEALISQLAGGRRRRDRIWLTDQVKAHLDDPGCRIVVLTGAPGTGKSAVMAHLAQQRPDWLRYFIRRTSEHHSDAYRHEGGLASFLTQIGLQLLALHPEAFPAEDTQVGAEVVTPIIGPEGNVSVIRVAEWFAHPFRQGALYARLEAALVEGRASAVEIGKLVVDVASMEPAALEAPALLEPLRNLAHDSDEHTVVLLDGLDELRFRDVAADVGRWLAGHEGFPSNLRIVVASRPEAALLRELELRQGNFVRRVHIEPDSDDVRQDVEGYLRNLATESEIFAVLTSHGISAGRFVSQVSPKVGGNFLYLTMLTRLLDAEAIHRRPGPGTTPPVPDLDWLDNIETLPDELPAFYALLLWSVHNRLGGRPATRPQWEAVYRPLLGLLAVAVQPLTGRQFRAFGEITVDQAVVDDALQNLQFFLDGNRDNGFRLHHTSMAEFLTDKQTAQSDPPLYCDNVAWHGQIADHAIRQHQAAGSWRDADPYLRARLPFHAAESGRLDDLVEDPSYLLAADPDALVPEIGAVNRAELAARVYQQVVPLLRDGNLVGAQAHLKLYAEQAHLSEFAARIPMDREGTPWLLDYTRWQRVQLRQVLGRHDGEVDAVTIARDARSHPLAVTSGVDGRLRIWDLMRGREADGRSLPDRLDGATRPNRVTALAAGELDSGEAVVVSGGLDGAVRVWNLVSRQAIGQPLIGPENAGFALAGAFVGSAPRVVCRIMDEFRAWDPVAQTPVGSPFVAEGILDDEPVAAARWHDRLVFAAVIEPEDTRGRLQVWDTATGTPCGPVIQAADDWITAIAMAETGGTLLVAVADGDNGIQVFDVVTGQPWTRRTLDIGLPLVNALAIGRVGDQAVLAAGDESGHILFRELPSLRRFGDPVQAHDRQVTALAFGSDANSAWLASVGNEPAAVGAKRPVAARFWVPGKSGRKLRSAAAPIRLPGPARSVTLATVNGQLELMIVDGHQAVRWDVRGGDIAGTPVGGRNDRVCAVGIATVAGRTIAVSATYDEGTIRTWDIPECTPARHPVTGEPLVRRDIEPVRGLAVTRLDDRAVTVCAGWSGIHVWDAATGEPAGAGLITGLENVMALAVGELDGRPIVACAAARDVRVFDLETGAPLDPPHPGGGFHSEAVAIAEYRGRTLVVSGGSNLTIRTWNPATRADPAVIKVAGETSVLAATHVRGQPVAVCSGRKGEVRLVDLAATGISTEVADDPVGAVNGLAVAEIGGQQVAVCASDNGVQVLDLVTGEEAAPPPPQFARRKAIAVAVGSLHDRPIALAGGYPNHAWYLDTGEPLPRQPAWPETVYSVAIANAGGRAIAVASTRTSGAVVADLETGDLLGEPVTGFPGGAVLGVGVVTVADRPVLVARTSMVIRARPLELPWLPRREEETWYPDFADRDETPPPPLLFPARRLTSHPHDGGWCMALGSFEGQPIVLSGHDQGEIDLVVVASGLPFRPALAAGTSSIGALAYQHLGPRPVIAAGAIDGVVCIADLTDLSAQTVIRTLAPVRALALAEPDRCLIGTEKGLIAIRILFRAQAGPDTRRRVHLPVDIRAVRACPLHDNHRQAVERGGRTITRLCLKGVQLSWRARKADSLSYQAGHCYVMPGRLEIVADGHQSEQDSPPLIIGLAGLYAESVEDPEAYLTDGCHFGVAVHVDGRYRVLSCYRRSERDWLLGEIGHH